VTEVIAATMSEAEGMVMTAVVAAKMEEVGEVMEITEATETVTRVGMAESVAAATMGIAAVAVRATRTAEATPAAVKGVAESVAVTTMQVSGEAAAEAVGAPKVGAVRATGTREEVLEVEDAAVTLAKAMEPLRGEPMEIREVALVRE
jgi:hypothetical protein